jgi:hypothetical protein
MQSDRVDNRFKTGVGLCWLSLLTLPIGLLAIGGGPCAGPRNVAGCLILLVAGSSAVVMPVFGLYHMFPGSGRLAREEKR